jgi:ESCRT-I complex subunit TSG101
MQQANVYPGSNAGNTAAAAAAAANASHFHAYNPIVSQQSHQGQQGANPNPNSTTTHQHVVNTAGGNAGAATNHHNNSIRDQTSVVSKDPPSVVFKEHAADALARRVLKTFQAIERHTTQSVEDRLGEQQVLEERSSKLTDVSQALAKERDMIDECIHKYESKTLELEDWLSKHREIDKDITADLDAVFIPSDPLSAQALEVVAKDMAIEDALYSLEQALLNDTLGPEVYLKQVRSLCRKQFYHRKLCMKIADAQKEQEALHPQRPRTLSKDKNGDLGDWEILQDMNLNK